MQNAKLDALVNNLRAVPTGYIVAFKKGEAFAWADASEIVAVRKSHEIPDGAVCVLADHREELAMKRFKPLCAELGLRGNWLFTRQDLFVNMNRVVEIPASTTKDFTLLTDTGLELPLSAPFVKPVQSFYGIPTLKHVTPLSRPLYWLIKLGIKECDKKIREMSVPELKAVFGRASTGEVVISDLIASFLFQEVSYIRAGAPSPVQYGNVRSLWYLIKPTIARLGALYKSNHYKTLSKVLSDMTAHKILKYREFGLYEDGKWAIGLQNPHVILMAEKAAHFGYLKELQNLTGATIIATGGQPASFTNEYFTDAFKEKVSSYHKPGAITVLALVDYDPFGWKLLDTFRENLSSYGIRRPRIVNLSVPSSYTPEEIETNHMDLVHESDQDDPDAPVLHLAPSTLKWWMKLTNGINGNKWGIQVNVLFMDIPRVKKLILEAGTPYWHAQPPVSVRVWDELEAAKKKIARRSSK